VQTLSSPLRFAVTALAQVLPAQPTQSTVAQAEPAEPLPPKCPANYLWAVLIARNYEVFPLLCPMCGEQMCLIASQSPTAPLTGKF